MSCHLYSLARHQGRGERLGGNGEKKKLTFMSLVLFRAAEKYASGNGTKLVKMVVD